MHKMLLAARLRPDSPRELSIPKTSSRRNRGGEGRGGERGRKGKEKGRRGLELRRGEG